MQDGETIHAPLATYRYRLTLVDALAYERLPGEWSVKAKLAFLFPLIAIGAFSGLIEDWTRLWWWLAVAGLILLWAIVGLLVYNWRIDSRARKMAIREGQTEVEEWNDHLAIRSQAGVQYLPYELIAKVIITDAHVFILYHGGPTILPLRVFEDAQAMRVFGEAIDKRSEQAVP
jgi:uncharacterized membrane protein